MSSHVPPDDRISRLGPGGGGGGQIGRVQQVVTVASNTRHNAAVGSPGLVIGHHSLTVASRCGVPTGFTSLLDTSPDTAALGVKRTAFGQRGTL